MADVLDDVTRDFEEVSSKFYITDPQAERQEVVALMAHWGARWADLKERVDIAHAGYRNWSGGVVTTVLAEDPKIPEWKAKGLIEGTKQFLDHKLTLARLEKAQNKAWTAFESFKQKAILLGQLITREASELRLASEVSRVPYGTEPDKDPRVEAIKQNNRAKRATTKPQEG